MTTPSTAMTAKNGKDSAMAVMSKPGLKRSALAPPFLARTLFHPALLSCLRVPTCPLLSTLLLQVCHRMLPVAAMNNAWQRAQGLLPQHATTLQLVSAKSQLLPIHPSPVAPPSLAAT